MTPYLKKENPDLPDNYGIIVHFVNGQKVELEVATHKIIQTVILYGNGGGLFDQNGKEFRYEASPAPHFEFWTKDDRLVVVPINSVEHIEFDKRWTKIKEIQNKEASQKKNQI